MTESTETLHPGRILLSQAMEPLGISRNQLARDIDVPVGRISDITNGKRGVTADTALRLGRYFGTGPELWLRLQAEFDLYVARMTTWPAVESRVRVLKSETPEVAPVAVPVTAPVDKWPSADEAEIENEVFEGAEPERLADTFDEEVGSGSDTNPNSEIDTADSFEHPESFEGPEISVDVSNSDDEPIGSPQAVTIEPVSGDVDPEPGAVPALESDPEEDLGIPPVPDRSKLFMSG